MERPTLSMSPVERDAPRRARITLLESRPERLAGHHGRTANLSSVMEFYWRNPSVENVTFFDFLRSPSPSFLKLFLLPDAFL
jgi:hypothetical protein